MPAGVGAIGTTGDRAGILTGGCAAGAGGKGVAYVVYVDAVGRTYDVGAGVTGRSAVYVTVAGATYVAADGGVYVGAGVTGTSAGYVGAGVTGGPA